MSSQEEETVHRTTEEEVERTEQKTPAEDHGIPEDGDESGSGDDSE